MLASFVDSASSTSERVLQGQLEDGSSSGSSETSPRADPDSEPTSDSTDLASEEDSAQVSVEASPDPEPSSELPEGGSDASSSGDTGASSQSASNGGEDGDILETPLPSQSDSSDSQAADESTGETSMVASEIATPTPTASILGSRTNNDVTLNEGAAAPDTLASDDATPPGVLAGVIIGSVLFGLLLGVILYLTYQRKLETLRKPDKKLKLASQSNEADTRVGLSSPIQPPQLPVQKQLEHELSPRSIAPPDQAPEASAVNETGVTDPWSAIAIDVDDSNIDGERDVDPSAHFAQFSPRPQKAHFMPGSLKCRKIKMSIKKNEGNPRYRGVNGFDDVATDVKTLKNALKHLTDTEVEELDKSLLSSKVGKIYCHVIASTVTSSMAVAICRLNA
jgi:hypothetical protein